MKQYCKKYRDNTPEKEKLRHQLYNLNNKELIQIQKQKYKELEYYCPVCFTISKLYCKSQHVKSALHTHNTKSYNEQQQSLYFGL
jgi:hypothetical protein